MLQTLVDISLKSLVSKRGMRLSLKRKKEKKEKRKRDDKKEKKHENKDSPCSHQKIFHDPIRERYVSRSIIKCVYPSIHHITTHMHILI